MSLIDWRNFSRKPEIKNLPLHQQKKLFEEANRKATENNWFLEYQLVAGASGAAFSGIGVDGPIAGATVISSVGATTTNAAGEFTFASTPTGPITLKGGKDAITGVDFEGELVGFPEYKTISPITTFAHYLQQADAEVNESPMTIDQAVTKTFESSSVFFGVEIPLEEKDVILQKDFVREAIENNNKVGISAQAVTTQIEAIAETVGASLEGSSIQEELTKKFGRAGEIPQFRPENRKRTAYAALGRSVLNRGDINIEEVVGKVEFVNPIDGLKQTKPAFNNFKRLQDQLTATITETRTLARSEQFTNNYLTTRIQALNRAQKTTIKNEAATAVRGGTDFSNIQTVSTSTSNFNGLSRIEKDKANETTEQLDKVNDWPSAGSFTQERFDAKNKRTFQEKLRFREGVIESNYKYFGDVKDSPMLLLSKKVGSFEPAQFSAAINNEFGPVNSEKIFAKLPLTHTTESVDDATGAITTQTTVFRPYILDQPRGETPNLVGLRLSSLTTSVTQPKNTVEHLAQSGGDYTGTLTTNGKTETIFLTEILANTGPKENPIIRLDVIMAKGADAAFRLQPAKRSGTFELVDLNDSNKIVATNLSFVSDRLTAKFTGEKGGNKELFIKFTKTPTVTHIASSGTYTISKPLGLASIMDIKEGFSRSLKVSYDSLGIEITQSSAKNDGQFTVTIEGSSIGTNFRFVDNVLSFTNGTTTYRVQYQAPK